MIRRTYACSAIFLPLLLNSIASAQPLTPQQRQEDLQVLARELPKRHKNAFFKISRADFETRVRKIEQSLSTASDLEIRSALVKLVAAIGDGHTSVDALRGGKAYPIGFRVFPDGLYVTAAAPAHADTLGARLVTINRTPAAQVRERMAAFITRENAASEMADLPGWLTKENALRAEGIVGSPNATFHFERAGRSFTLELTRAEGTRLSVTPEGVKPPLYQSHRHEASKDYWHE